MPELVPTIKGRRSNIEGIRLRDPQKNARTIAL